MLLAADIGGTKSLLALCDLINGKPITIAEKNYPSKDFGTLEELARHFLTEALPAHGQKRIASACFSLAGPVREGFCDLVNLPLTVNMANVRAALPEIPQIVFCNDLEATASGLLLLSAAELLCLTPEIERKGTSNKALRNKALIAPGTGLGEALIMEGKVYPSEGGHCEFGPRSEEEIRLWRFLHKEFGHVSYERLLSGPGLQNIYGFLAGENQLDQYAGRTDTRTERPPAPAEISKKAQANLCPLCAQSLRLFTSILGAEAGNLALKSLAFGGIYLGGGIVPQILPALQDGSFLDSFRAKGRFSGLLAEIPVYIILNPKAALYGAAFIAFNPQNRAV